MDYLSLIIVTVKYSIRFLCLEVAYMGVSHVYYQRVKRDNAISLKQSLLEEHPNRHTNRMNLDNITEQINKLALSLSDVIAYEKAVDYILNLIADITLPNTIERYNLEFDLFCLRYFYWAEHELKNKGVGQRYV